MDDDTTGYPTSTPAEPPSSDTAAPRVGDLPAGRPSLVRTQDPAEPVHVIDPGDVGGIGQHKVSTPPEAPAHGQAGTPTRGSVRGCSPVP